MRRKIILLSIFFLLFSFVGMFGVKRVVQAYDQPQYESDVRTGEEKSVNSQYWGTMNVDILMRALLNKLGGPWSQAGKSSDLLSDQGAIQGVGNMIATTFEEKPADTQTYVADLLQDMHIVQPAYAQGLGFSSLRPILELWKVFRNIAYVFFVLVFLIIGFAIMFRQNLGGQTAVTVQQAIPKIIVALVAVTFSYAIAGLLIDIMYVIMFFLVQVFASSGLVSTEFVTTDITNGSGILNQNIFDVFRGILSKGFTEDAGAKVGGFIRDTLNGVAGGDAIGFGAGFLSSLLATVVLFIAVLISMFKTFIALIKVYLEIVLSIVFAPIILMMAAINNGVFANWIKGLVANLAVFPAMLVFILVAYMFLNLDDAGVVNIAGDLNTGGFLPPFIPGRGSANNIALIVGVAVVMLLSEVPGMLAKFKPKSIFDEFAGTAFKNATSGEIALPLLGGAIGGTYGGVKVARTRDFAEADWRQKIRYLRRGVEKDDGSVIGGIGPRMGTGAGVGTFLRQRIDDARDGRLGQVDNPRALAERIIKGQAPKEKPEEAGPKRVKS